MPATGRDHAHVTTHVLGSQAWLCNSSSHVSEPIMWVLQLIWEALFIFVFSTTWESETLWYFPMAVQCFAQYFPFWSCLWGFVLVWEGGFGLVAHLQWHRQGFCKVLCLPKAGSNPHYQNVQPTHWHWDSRTSHVCVSLAGCGSKSLIIESYDILTWKGPTRLIELNSMLLVGLTKTKSMLKEIQVITNKYIPSRNLVF